MSRPPPSLSALLGALTSASAEGMPSEIAERHDGARIRARAGQEVFSQGDPSDTVYVLVEGEAAATVRTGLTTPPERHTLLLRAPAVFGDRDVLAGIEALEGIRCLTAATLLAWSAEDFLGEWERDDALRSLLARDLARRHVSALVLRRLEELPLPQRLPVLIAATTGGGEGSAPPSARYLALLANATVKSVQRALAARSRRTTSRAFGELDADIGLGRLFHSLVVSR